ncbi:FAD-linked oxidoreductase [Brevibacterium sanguinis]|uniref:FAD-linked oxidoreductase n=2 Tax=Brevibacterium TaxID=1696 RepID=A0A366ILP0_9MICO|nr:MULTISPECIES: D-arabinono-1,4-lactone oxidase [Brevibacterium]RBP67116.1 FAD-linked oxidoreductase [Brevibacterium sanguinis]RBP73641.1 FAD-linked oxidoreductase [Brevibacterium celere]
MPTRQTFRNWSGHIHAHPRTFVRPTSAEELGALVARTADRGGRIRVVGAGHSFTPLAAGDDVMVNLDRLSGIVAVDEASARVRFHAGTRLRDIPTLLRPHGLALANQGDVNPQALAGAISTGTHGTGLGFTGFAGTVTALTLMGPDGAVRKLSPDGPAAERHAFDLARVSLGALGIITEIELQCVPAFDLIAEEVVAGLDELLDGLVEKMRAADHFEFFWFPHTTTALTKTNTRVPAGAAAPAHLAEAGVRNRVLTFLDKEVVENGALRLACELGAAMPALVPRINRLAQAAVSDRTYRAPGHDVFVTPRRVRFNEMEYAVPLDAGPAAIREIRDAIAARGWRISFPLEVRSAAADDVPLSTACGRESMYIAVHRFVKEDCEEYFRIVERICRSHGGRPHWGKMHTLGPEELREIYPRFDEFRSLRDALDPRATFGNRYTDSLFGRR